MIKEMVGSSDYFFVRPVSFHGFGIYRQVGLDKAEIVAQDMTEEEANNTVAQNTVIRTEMQKEAVRRMHLLKIDGKVINHFATGIPMMYENGTYTELSPEQRKKIENVQRICGIKIYLLKKVDNECKIYSVSPFRELWEEERNQQLREF